MIVSYNRVINRIQQEMLCCSNSDIHLGNPAAVSYRQ